MIIGYTTHRIKTEKVPELTCPACNKGGTTKVQHYQQYFYAGFIPFLPGAKKGIIMCDSCGYGADSQSMVPEHKAVYRSRIPATPKWMYIGTILMLVAILFTIYGKMTGKFR